jgi:hypothetical protein
MYNRVAPDVDYFGTIAIETDTVHRCRSLQAAIAFSKKALRRVIGQTRIPELIARSITTDRLDLPVMRLCLPENQFSAKTKKLPKRRRHKTAKPKLKARSATTTTSVGSAKSFPT